jgi:hypothetical protein
LLDDREIKLLGQSVKDPKRSMHTRYPISIFGFVVFTFNVPAFPFFASFFFFTKLGKRLGSEDFITKHDGVTQDNAPTGPTQDGTDTCSA